MDRPISPNETAVVRWLLDHAAVGDVASYQIQPLEELRVLKGCDCGCSSLDFQLDAWGGATIIADAWAVYPDGKKAGLILWGRAGEIVLLEVYDGHPEASHRFPDISICDLSFEGRGHFSRGSLFTFILDFARR